MTVLARKFAKNETWKDLQNPKSELYRFVVNVCSDTQETTNLSVRRLCTLAVLQCAGDYEKKATELFEIIWNSNTHAVMANDKSFKSKFEELLLFATQMVFEQEPVYMQTEKNEVHHDLKEKLLPLQEEFLEAVFGFEDQLDRRVWENNVATRAFWVFDPQIIRDKVVSDNVFSSINATNPKQSFVLNHSVLKSILKIDGE